MALVHFFLSLFSSSKQPAYFFFFIYKFFSVCFADPYPATGQVAGRSCLVPRFTTLDSQYAFFLVSTAGQPSALLKIELNDTCEVITIAQFRYDVLSASSVQFGRLYWSEFEFKDEKGGEVQLTVMNCALYCSMEAQNPKAYKTVERFVVVCLLKRIFPLYFSSFRLLCLLLFTSGSVESSIYLS